MKAPGLRLYNLDSDIGETTEVSAQHPDIVKKLKELADKEAASLCDLKNTSGVRPPGKVSKPQPLFPEKAGASKKEGKKGRKSAAADESSQESTD